MIDSEMLEAKYKSLTYTRKRGPKIDPCRIPHFEFEDRTSSNFSRGLNFANFGLFRESLSRESFLSSELFLKHQFATVYPVKFLI